MKTLEINITKAKIAAFDVELREEKVSVRATIQLYTKGMKPITTYSISSDGYNKDHRFDLMPSIVNPILSIAQQLEEVVVRHCENAQKLMGEGK